MMIYNSHNNSSCTTTQLASDEVVTTQNRAFMDSEDVFDHYSIANKNVLIGHGDAYLEWRVPHHTTTLTAPALDDKKQLKGVNTTEDAHLSALALTRLLQGSAEEVLTFLSAEQLIELGRNVRKLKRLANSGKNAVHQSNRLQDHYDNAQGNSMHQANYSNRLQEAYPNQFWTPLNTLKMDGVQREKPEPFLQFTYSSRGVLQEYCIRIDIENIQSSTLPEAFKQKNCVYPRAMRDRSQYTGNRYEYETSVNDIAWRLAWINIDTLAGKRGLIQRAVDTYRNRFNVSRSRRVVRQEKLLNGTLRRRSDSHTAYLPHGRIQNYRLPSPLFHDSISSNAPLAFSTAKSSQKIKDEESTSSFFFSTISYYDVSGHHATMKIRLDIDTLDEYEEIKNPLPDMFLKDELGKLLLKLNYSFLSENPGATRASIDAFKYKILTCDPARLSPDISRRVTEFQQLFGSLLAPVPPRQSLSPNITHERKKMAFQDGLDMLANQTEPSPAL